MILVLLLAILLLTGCATRTHLTVDEYGKATHCHWIKGDPYLCTYNPNRVTIDLDQLSDLLSELDRRRVEEFDRRKL